MGASSADGRGSLYYFERSEYEQGRIVQLSSLKFLKNNNKYVLLERWK